MNKNDKPPPYSPPGFQIPPQRPPTAQAYPPPQSQAYPPPQTQAYLPIQGQPPLQQTVIVVNAPTMMLGPRPTPMTCPSCQARITTTMETQVTPRTHMCAFLMFMFLCWPCCCLPYFIDSCQAQNHYCPNCKAYLGRYDYMDSYQRYR